jgi:hypothetical protein
MEGLMSSRIQFQAYKGKKILVEDFTNMKPDAEFLKQIDEARKTIASQPEKTVLAVFDATGASFNTEILTAMKEFTKKNTPYIRGAAVVGVNGLLQVALSTISRFAGRDFISFKTRAEAMDWLVTR